MSLVKEERGRCKRKKKTNQHSKLYITLSWRACIHAGAWLAQPAEPGVIRWGGSQSQCLVNAHPSQKMFSYILVGFCLAYRPSRPSPDLLLLSLYSDRIPGMHMWRSEEHSWGASEEIPLQQPTENPSPVAAETGRPPSPGQAAHPLVTREGAWGDL